MPVGLMVHFAVNSAVEKMAPPSVSSCIEESAAVKNLLLAKRDEGWPVWREDGDPGPDCKDFSFWMKMRFFAWGCELVKGATFERWCGLNT